MSRRSQGPLSEHVQRLQAEQERLEREMAEAEKMLRRKPKPAPRAKAVPERQFRMNTAALDLPRPSDHRIRGASDTVGRRPARRRKSDARYAQIKFLLLCVLLAMLLIFLWRNLPA